MVVIPGIWLWTNEEATTNPLVFPLDPRHNPPVHAVFIFSGCILAISWHPYFTLSCPLFLLSNERTNWCTCTFFALQRRRRRMSSEQILTNTENQQVLADLPTSMVTDEAVNGASVRTNVWSAYLLAAVNDVVHSSYSSQYNSGVCTCFRFWIALAGRALICCAESWTVYVLITYQRYTGVNSTVRSHLNASHFIRAGLNEDDYLPSLLFFFFHSIIHFRAGLDENDHMFSLRFYFFRSI